ncbi:helicase-related protein [uncultured Muribaculum sp.]|uniref:helicase-related protein n=1 Tax=uncultured Muribaculum sp. TaxID=1918613 RepID=UPI00259D0D5A|nr:helicase-related protein [uncultured Muribaculum sp.]
MKDEQKRRRFYTNMQEAYSLPDFDTFSQDIGAVVPPAPAQPAAQAQSQPQTTTATVKPITDTTAEQASVQQPVQTSAQPPQPQGWTPSPIQKQFFQFQMEQANARLKKQSEEAQQRMEGIMKGNKPGAFMGEREFNPATGEMETAYYTTQGERVPTSMQQRKANSDYHQWWENNTEAGQRSKEQRLQREFDARLSGLWQRHNPTEGENAAEQAWSAAESAYYSAVDRNRRNTNLMMLSAGNSAEAASISQMETVDNFTDRLTTHDMDSLMDNAWNNLGEEGQKALIDDCYQMLRYRYPGADGLVLYNQAKEFARQQSDLRMYNLAVEKNLPKSNLEYFMRKIGDMNFVTNIGKGIAVNRVKKTGDMAAYEAANEQYRQDGHKILDVAGMVAGFALDPTTWMSAGVGGAAARGSMWLGGRWLAGRGASAMVTQAASRQFATSMTGRIVGGIAGGAANFGTFEGVKEVENQFAHGGKVATMDENGNLLREGRYVNEGYSAGAVAGQFGHGLMMGAAVGWLGPVSGNVSDKLVRATSSTVGKVATRAGVYTGATLAEGTIFSVPEWIDGKRDAMDVWNDNMAMMVGFKTKHILKSAGGVLGDLKASFDSPTNGQKNRLNFESRLRQRMDAPSDGGMALTEDETAELKRYGYDLRDLVESSERTGDPAEGSLIAQNAPEIVSRLTDMVTDPHVSEAARAKMYYYATGRRLPMSTVMKGELIEDGNGGFIVESQGANGVITSRSFKSRKAADLELERIKRQTELNTIEIGERYQQIVDVDNRMQEASRRVAAKYGWDPVEVYKTYETVRDNSFGRGESNELTEVQKNIYGKIISEFEQLKENKDLATEKRNAINEKYGVDIDGAIRKEANRRTLQEQTAIDEYIEALIPSRAKSSFTGPKLLEGENLTQKVEDAEEVEATEMNDEQAARQGDAESEPIDPRFDSSTDPAPDYDPHQPGGEQAPIGRAVMKYQDRPVEVLSGRVVMMEDGTMIDNERSDDSIVIRDLATGKVEMVSPEAILTYEEYAPTATDVAEPMPTEAEDPAGDVQPQSQYTSGQIKIRNSDGTETRGVLTGYVDENGNHEYYVEGDLQHLHYASDHELDNILSEYVPDEPQPSAEQSQAATDRVYPEGVTDTEAYNKGLEDGAAYTSMSDEELNSKIERFSNESEVSSLTDYGRGWLEALKQEQQRRIQAAQSQQPEQTAPIEPTLAPAPAATPEPTPTPTTEPTPAPVPAEAPQGEVAMPTGVNPVGTIAIPQRDGSTRTFTVGKDAEGQNVVIDDRGFMWAHDGNGNAMQPYSPGANVPTWTDVQLSKLGAIQPANEQPATVPNQPETVLNSGETPQNPTENAVSTAETVPNPAVPVENVQETSAPTAEPTPLQRIPRDAKGEPIFEQAENPEHGWDALVEFAEGDASTAKEIADTMAEEKRKAYEKAQKQKPKGKTPTEILASKKAISAELVQAEQEYNLWQQMANVEQRRQDAIRSQQEAESRQRAAERAEAEKAERAAREEAARQEREALEGIPEWHLDTPENARKRGVRRFSGQMFTRQEPVQGVVGKEVEVKFSQKDLPKGHVAVIEASQLQPSHIQGQRNPMFFIEEAQPKNRAEAVSMYAAKEMAEGIRPQEITGSATAYTGAPTVNTRGEVIQGNNRSDALRYLWDNHLPEQQQTYKQYLLDNAEQLGLASEAINAMQHPVLVNMLDVDDAEAIRLGQMTAQDTESGGIERIKPKNVAQKLGEDMRSFASQLLRSGDEEATFGQLVDRNGTEVLKWMAQKGAITNTQYQSAFDSKGNLTAEAKNDLQKILYQAVFKGGSQQLEEMFDALPAKAQRAILSTAFRDMDSPFAGKMLPEIQASIAAYHQLMSDPTFAAAKKMEEALRAVEAFKLSIQLDDRFEQYMPADNFSNFALHLAAMYKANDMSQSTIAGYFNQMYDLAQGKKAATLFEEADTTEYPLADVIQQVLNIDYQPAKNGNNDVANGGADVALRNQDGQGGQLRGNEPPASGEQNPTGTEPSDRGAGTSDDSRAAAEAVKTEAKPEPQAPATVQSAVEAASAQVNTEPTHAQAEAGNYKKGHVTIGEFDITIENPAGSLRKGVDADGKEWSTQMANTYGYIKGTEGVDGDHIDVFLHENMDEWNGRKVFVVDQTNTDGSFDEHKVMLGFNDKDEAMTAYLANYDKTWANTHPGLRISETNIEDFNKWVQSSHRKTKPFAEYSTVSKVVDEVPVKTEPQQPEPSETPAQPAATIEGEGYKIQPKPYTNKQGKTLDTYLVTFYRDFSKEELSALRAKAKALKGWYDRESKGWMLRSSDDAKAFADEVAAKSEDEVADEAPLSMADMEKTNSVPRTKSTAKSESPIKQVDVEGVFDALKAKGETKLSDHAAPVGEPKPKKRKWISDEDADEFDSLRKDLRSHFGKDGDIVQEAGPEYGKPKPKQMDAEVLRMGTRMTYIMMKGGLRSFSDYCEAMKDELPDIFDEMRPHLKSLYAAAQNMEEVIELGWDEEMDDRKTVKAFDVYNFDKPGAKDIISTARHTVDENASQQQTDQIIQTLKDQRNEQRKKEADETSADTETIIDKAETTASQVESKLEAANSEEDAERLSRSLDKELEEVNKQLALLGYYEADPVDKDFNEAYGYMRNAERKAVQDAHRLATQLAADLGITIAPKDKVRKAKYGFGSKIARSNVAPAGGEVYITLPLAEDRELSIWLSLDKNAPWRDGGRADRTDEDLMLTHIMYRVENPGAGGMSRYVSGNHNTRPTIPYDELLSDIRRLVRTYLPDEQVKPATPLAPQPGEDIVDMAKRVASDKETKTPAVESQLAISDLFGGLFNEQTPQTTAPAKKEIAERKSKSETSTSKPKSDEKKTDVQPRTEGTGRGRQQPRPDEPLGEGAKHEDERTDGGRMAQRGGEHTVSDSDRGAGVSGLHPSERGVTTPHTPAVPKNTRNNHAERGTDYAPKGEKARIDANIAALELAKKLLASSATATPQEMAILRRYSGWGGLGAAFNEGSAWAPNPINKRLREALTPEEYQAAVMSRNSAYYTPAAVIDVMWDVAKALGFKGGNIVEGSAGIGNIIGLMPTDISERSNIHAVEIDPTTGGILSLLYPDAQVEVQGFEQTRIANGSVDLAITNVPFVTDLHVMDESGDSDLSKKFRDIHDFCIAKNVRKLREGGIGIFITSSGTLDKSQKLRTWLVGNKEGNADVVGVFRMNNQTFGGTAATSDIIVVRKRVNGRKSANAIDVSTVTPARTATFTDARGKTKDLPLYVNRYFIEHPEHMGGEMFFGFEQGDTYRPTSIGLFPTRTADQSARMAAWVQHLTDMDWSKEQGKAATKQTSHINEALGEGVKEGSMVTDSEGNLCVARMGRAVPLTLNKNKIKGRTKEECFKDYTEIKSALADVLKYQTEHDDDAGLQPFLDRLNRAYDTFVHRYGNLNKNNNLAWLRNDVDFSSIVALETYSEKGNKDGTKVKTYGKTDIFSRRVVEKESEPTPKNVKDGIIASIYKYGRIDTEYLATQLGKSQDDVKQEIVESGLGFVDPTTGQMEVSYEYLSGNVREKLRQAREANEAAGGAYDANIKALEAVVPMNIPAHLIEFALGSSWIEPQLYERYVKERTELDVKLTNAGGTWHMSEPWNTDKPKNTEMGVRSEAFGILIPGHKLIEAALTNKTITVSRTVKDSDGGSHTETDPAATTACATKVDEIRQDFKDWAREQMQNDPALSMRMEEKYNEKFNNSVPKTIPDEFVPEHFGGAATTVGGKPFKLRPHQAKAVIRATTQPVLLAHEVGTGKTYTLITTAMEMRRLGTARKPMIVVQNATVGQFVASAKALYPNAKVLTLEDADRNAEGRRAFYAKIKFNDWDMIVVPQSVFERIPDSIERQTQFIQDKIEEKMLVLEQMKEADPDGRSMIVRAAEREISRLEDEMSQLASGEEPTSGKKKKDAKKAAITRQNAEVKARELLDRATDDVEDFDSMGIDAILVDEAHEYKHLGFATAMQRGVKGVDLSPSKKSQGVFLKTQAVLEKTGGKNVVFATGTPISNTAAEIWTFMRYLIPADVMKEYDIYYFDDFVRNFGNLQQMLEFKTNGKYDEVNRFAGYVNLPELVRIWSTVADTVLTREAGGVSDKIPQMEGGKAQDIFLPQTRALRSIMKFVKDELKRYEDMTGKEKKENSHIPLVMYGIAKAAAVDARLVQSDAEDDPNSKTNEAVRQTLRTLEETKDYKGTVAIFADNYQNKASGFNLYEDIRKKLIAAGVPEEQVVVMKSGMTVKKKLEIFDRVNAGEVRVVMGSTFTLGTGVNIQERLHTLIHLDAPNRPMDYTQRNGRILRQGNLHNTWGLPVRVLRFGVEDSLDVTAYQRLKTKGAIADSIMNGKQLMANSMENRSLEEDQDLFGDITAQLSGSEYAMLKNQIEKEVRKLRAAEKNWKADQTYIHNRKRQITGQNREAEKRIADNKGYLEKIEAATIGDITVGKLSFPSVEAMEDFFTEQNKKKAAMQEQVRTSGYSSRPATSDITISVGGFNFKIHTEITKEMKHQQGDLFATAPAKMTYSCPELGIDAMPVRGNAIKNAVLDIMENVVSGKDFRERIAHAENYLERNNAEFEAISKRDGQPFKDAEALAKAEKKLAEYEELMKAEMAAKEAKYAEMDKDVEAASGIELTEEDSEPTASEPVSEYSTENANFVSRYETKDGKTVRYTSENPEAYGGLFDFDFSNEVPGADNAAEGGRINRRQQSNPPLQRRNAALLDTNASARLNEANGEYCALERKFRESNYMEFTSAEKVESADDVAFIFEELENASVENVFVVMTKRGVPTVMHISIGGFNWSAMNAAPVKLAYDRIKPDKVYFVHNHPSGALNCSPQDVNCLKQIESAIGKKAEGVIMDLKSGKYGTFDSSGTSSSASHDKAPAPAAQRRLRLYAFDRHVFNPDYQPSEKMSNAEDVAKFLSSHRLGDRSKVSVLVCNNQNQIVANVHTTHVSIDSKGLADDIIRAIGEFGGMHAFLYGDFEQSGMVAYRNLTQAVKERSGGVYNLLDVVRIEGNHTWSARDNGYVYEPGTEYGASPEGDIRFREVEDNAVLKEFAEGKTVKAYRTMQVIDGKLYSPMATKVGGKTTPEIKLGVPEQAEEHPEIIKRTKVGRDGVEVGYVVIDKGLGKGTLEVAYNPSIHASLTPLNDQFTSADIRPNLVIVESLIPKSELTSGYRAPMAKDAVGEMSWHSGTVSGKLAELGKPRRVILSRYDMPVRIVPFKEVAQMIAAQLEGTDIDIPYNVVTPQVRMELQHLGIAISDTPSGSVGENRDFGKAEYITDQEIERINAHQQEMAQTSPEAKSSHAEKLAKKFNSPIQVVADPKELTSDNADRQAHMRRSKGFYDPATGKVVVVLPNNANVEDVAETVFHEVVAHKGLREMLGDENYDAFCDEVYDHLKDDLKEEVDRETTRRFEREPEKGYEHHRRVSVDELFGRMAEKGFEDFTKAERGIWAKLKAKVLEAINKFLGSLKLPKWVRLGDNELRYMLWRSHEKLRTKGDYVDMARDAAKRDELGLTDEARFRDGETGDIWKDQSVGLQERITNAAIRLSNNQSGDLTLRNDAQKAVVNNLQSLLHSMRNRRGTAQSFVGADRKVEAGVVGAMNAQAMFDRATVKRVSDLARILMQNGYLSGMTSGEMQRLLSVVKNATAMHDIADSVQKIMDIMVNNQLRNAEGALRQLLSIRGSKVDARGVEVQGVLDVDGQHTMEVVKKAMSLSEDDITDRIAEALNRMGDPDQTIADQAALEYAGLNMALDYVQNIANSKAEEKTLRDSLKTAKEDRDAGRMTDDAYKQFVEATEDAIRKNKVERAEAYFNLVGRLSDSLRESIENAKAFREAEKARVSEIHHNANSDMEGRPTNEHHKDNWKDKFVNNGFVQFLFAPLGTFDQILRVFGNKSANGEGYLWNRFMRGWVDCRNKELTGVKEKFARLDEKAAELFGKGKTWGNLIRMEAKMPKASVSFWDGGEMRDHELTQGNLLYIYMVDKMTDGRMKLRRMGITEDDITRIENFLDPRFKALGDWLQDEFLVDTRNEYNETHKRMFGASMAAIENYFPLKILANARIDKEEDVNQQNRPDGITTKTGSIIKRRVNNLALDITGADALSVILDHITQMEHWSAYAEWNRDLNTLRTYKRFRNQVINMTTVYGGGRKLWENFNDLCLMAAGEYHPPVSKLNKSAVNLAKGVTAAKVSFRMYTALKQLLSAPAYAPEVSTRAILKSIANPYGDFKWCLENMPIFRERWHSRISGDPRLLKSDMDWKMWRSRIMELSSRIGMTPNAFVDAVTVSIGAKAMYETRLKQYLKEGYPTDAAEKRAMQDATILFNQTQQSSESPFLSTMQVDKDWLSTLFTVFRNSSMSYTRQEFDAMRNLKRNLTPGQRAKSIEFMTKQILRDWDVDPDTATDAERNQAHGAAKKRFRKQIKKDILRLATFGFILELAWNLGPYLPYVIFGNNEDEKDKMWDDAMTHAYFGSVEGLTGGDVMSSFGNMWASGEWNWNQLSKDMPLASDINTIATKFIGGKNAEAVNDILNLLVQMGVGMNPQSITDTAIAITDACGDDPALSHEAAIFIMRVLQVPQSQIDKIYFDEVDLTGEEASKLTPAQLAQRYAEYKVKRGTPLAPWSWGDEERLGKYNDLAADRMKERLDAQGDATVIKAYADFEARYKAVSEKAKEAKVLMKTDYTAAAQAHAALQQDPDFILYQRFGSLDKQLGRISKMWLTSKSPAEAALVASTITSYRAGMVKVLQAETAESQQSAMSELTTLMNDFSAKYQGMQPKQVNR